MGKSDGKEAADSLMVVLVGSSTGTVKPTILKEGSKDAAFLEGLTIREDNWTYHGVSGVVDKAPGPLEGGLAKDGNICLGVYHMTEDGLASLVYAVAAACRGPLQQDIAHARYPWR